MTRRLLDTNIWIAIAKGDREATSRLRQLRPSQVATCSVVRAELPYSARKSARVEHNLANVDRLLAPFCSLPFDDAAAAYYGSLRAFLERAGTPIGANDMLIAATALATAGINGSGRTCPHF